MTYQETDLGVTVRYQPIMEDSRDEFKRKMVRNEISGAGNGGESESLGGKPGHEDFMFDYLMEEVGNDGKFQKRFNFLYNFVVVMIFTMPYLNIILAMTIPEHWCRVPGREATNLTLDEWKARWLPRDKKDGSSSFSSCEMFAENDTSGTAVGCRYGWEFDRRWYTETVPSEESWVCDKEIYVSNTFAAGRVGEIIGTLVFGQLGDRFGRKPVFYITVFILIVGRTISAFTSSHYYLFLFSISLGSMASTSVFQSPLVISMEISKEKKRSHITFLQCLGWVVGLCLLSFISWALKDWKLIMLVTTLPNLACFFCYKLLPESPRWLASRGRVEEAVEVLEYIARVNNRRIPRDTYSVLEKIGNKKEKFYGMASLFANWRLAKNSIIIMACWTTSSVCYYVITLNVTNMSGNPFLNFFCQSLVELPGYILGKVLSERLGRRWTQSSSYALCSLFCLGTLLVQTLHYEHLVIHFVALVKLALTTSFYMVWLQAIEIYPTCVRQTGTSIGGMVANLIGTVGPYIVYLGTSIDMRIPYVILLAIILIGGFLSTFLPETLNKKLPETLEDAKMFGKNQSYFSLNRTKPMNKSAKY